MSVLNNDDDVTYVPGVNHLVSKGRYLNYDMTPLSDDEPGRTARHEQSRNGGYRSHPCKSA